MSAERQLAYAAAWAATHGLELDAELSLRDEGLSAYHQRHVRTGALGAFLAAVDAGRVPHGSVLIVEQLDRLSRAEPIVAQAQLAQIVNAGVTVVTAADNKTYSRESLRAAPMDLVYSLLVMIRAHEESDTKSKRVKDSIVRQCQAWIAGTYRGRIVNGKDPEWVRFAGRDKTECRWEFVPERVAAVRYTLDLYRKGYGGDRIVRGLTEAGLRLVPAPPTAHQLYRFVRQEALSGTRVLEVDGQKYVLQGYYPALLTPEEWAELQTLNEVRARTKMRVFQVPGVITGVGMTVCGYCGTALIGINQGGRLRADGTLADGHRRLVCVAYNDAKACPGPRPSTVSMVPAERAVLQFCSDRLNLASLFRGGDRGTELKTAAQSLLAEVGELERKLGRITDAMLEADAPVGSFTKRARELERELTKARSRYASAERELAALSRSSVPPNHATEWRAVTEGALALDHDSRLKARQLVLETFERIVVYRCGADARAPRSCMDIVLVGKGGVTRVIRVDRGTGAWVAAEDVELPAALPKLVNSPI